MSNLPAIRKEIMSDRAIEEFQDALPSATGKHAKEIAMRYAKMGYAAISQNPTLQTCSVKSLIRSMSQSASLDLEIDQRGLAYLVPYKNKGVIEAQLQIGYMGLMELAYRSTKVKSITANCIYESEKDNVKIRRKDGKFTVEHPFSYEQPTGKMIAVYATAQVDGIPPQTIVLRAAEVERLRANSKAPDSPAWKNHYEAMAKKTAIRQLAKFLPKSAAKELTLGAAIDEYEDFVTAQANATKKIQSESGSEPVDTNFESEEAPNAQDADDFMSDEPDAETKAEAEKQQKKLAAAAKKAEAELKTRSKRQKKKSKDALPKFHCNGTNCSKPDFNEPNAVDEEKGNQCPNCYSWNTRPNETA